MNKAVGWMVGVLGWSMIGCGPDAAGPGAGTPSPMLEASLQAIGGREPWMKVKTVCVMAVVALYDEHGQMYVDRQDQEYDLRRGCAIARGHTAHGPWIARASSDGTGTFEGSGSPADPALRKRMVAALAMALHRVGGPLNFVLGPERPRGQEPVRVAGQDLIRVGVGSDNRWAMAYYFEPDSKLPHFVTAGGDHPGPTVPSGARGTVTEYTYMRLPNGMAFPQSIRVVRIGENALVGTDRVLDMDFSNVRIQ